MHQIHFPTITDTLTITNTLTITPTPTRIPTEPPPAQLTSAQYVYDGDGNMVKGTLNGTVNYYPSRQYLDIQPGGTEIIQKSYMVGSLMVATAGTIGGQTTLNWILSDQVPSRGCYSRLDHFHRQCGWELEQPEPLFFSTSARSTPYALSSSATFTARKLR
jgi:hypothetical protein